MTVGRPRVVVCGATFGRHHARALSTPDSPVEVVAVMGTGGWTGRVLADELGVRYVTSFDDVSDVDTAVIAVRATVVGGVGDDLARDALRRGIDVVQEMPVHTRDLVQTLRVASEHGRMFAVNAFYDHLPTVRDLIAVVTDVETTVREVHVRTSVQVLHAVMQVVGMVLRRGPGSLDVHPVAGEGRFLISGNWGRTPVDIVVSNALDPRDPNNNCHPLMDVTVTTDGGELRLMAPHSPLVWTRRLHESDGEFDVPDARMVECAAPLGVTGHDVVAGWHAGIRTAMQRFLGGDFGVDQRTIAVCRSWEIVSAAMGPAVHRPVPPTAAADFSPFGALT